MFTPSRCYCAAVFALSILITQSASGSPQPKGSSPLTLSADMVMGDSGTQVAACVRASSFTDMIGMQGTLTWMDSVATFSSFDSFGIRDLSAANFNTGTPGQITFVWNDPLLTGVTTADNDPLFCMVFEVVGAVGTFTSIAWSDLPTTLEFVDTSLTTLPFVTVDGSLESTPVDLVHFSVE